MKGDGGCFSGSARRASADQQLLAADPPGQVPDEELNDVSDVVDRTHPGPDRAPVLGQDTDRIIRACPDEVASAVCRGRDDGVDGDCSDLTSLTEPIRDPIGLQCWVRTRIGSSGPAPMK